MDFACCSSFCESEVVEVVSKDRVNERQFGEYEPQAGGFAVGSQMQPQQESASPKVRLRRVIKDFAHKVVGAGLYIQARSELLSETANGPVLGLVRMDKGLRRLEIQTRSVAIVIPLADIKCFTKDQSSSDAATQPGALNDGKDPATVEVNGNATDQNAALTVVQQGGPDLEMLFESSNARDQAYTCFKIFHMSVVSSMDSQSLSTEATMNCADEA